MRTTYTYAVLEVSPATYQEIRQKLEAAGYQHAFHQDSDSEVIDMRGIALRKDPAPRPRPAVFPALPESIDPTDRGGS